jgi:hypothetical protein
MPRLNRQNIDQYSNKPNPTRTEGLSADQLLNRAEQTRRDDDIIRTPQRTLLDVDVAIKLYIDQEIRPQITADKQLIPVPTIFSNGEKWDNVQRLGFLRDEKGMLQSPLIMLKRGSATERDDLKGIDVNRTPDALVRTYKQKYNPRNTYEDELFPIPNGTPASSDTIYIVDIPRYYTIEYTLMLWCDFTAQMNDLVDQLIPYSRFTWGNEGNRFPVTMGQISFETVNTIGEDRLVRATIPLTVQASLLSGQEARKSTLRKMYSIKKVTFDTVVDVSSDLFSTTIVPPQILKAASSNSGVRVNGANSGTLSGATVQYLIDLTEQLFNVTNETDTITIAVSAATNPDTAQLATVNEFDIYLNGQYLDKATYSWTPSTSQTIVFDTNVLGSPLQPDDVIVIKGRWA